MWCLSNETIIAFTAQDSVLSFIPVVASLVFRRDASDFGRATLCFALRIQLPTYLCYEFDPFFACRLGLRGVSEHLCVLASRDRTSGSRPCLPQHGQGILVHLPECARRGPDRR